MWLHLNQWLLEAVLTERTRNYYGPMPLFKLVERAADVAATWHVRSMMAINVKTGEVKELPIQ